jgi:hypothetical protein
MKYKLKKDTPYHKAGEVFENKEPGVMCVNSGTFHTYFTGLMHDPNEWFEPIEPTYSSQDMKTFAFKCVEYYFPQAMAGFDHHDRNEHISKLLEGFKK